MVSFTHGWAGNLCADHHRNLQIHHLVKLFPCCISELASENANKGLREDWWKCCLFSLFLPVLIYILSCPYSFSVSNSGSLLSNLFFLGLHQFSERLLLSLLSGQVKAFFVDLIKPWKWFGLSQVCSDLLGSRVFPCTWICPGSTSSSPVWWGWWIW